MLSARHELWREMHSLPQVPSQFNYRVTSLILLVLFLLIAECGANEFQCKSDHLCIPLSRVGDGQRDCPDGTDELKQDECDRENQFRCKCGSPVCIDRVHVMDGQIHCEDGSDEGLDPAGAGCMSNELSAGKWIYIQNVPSFSNARRWSN